MVACHRAARSNSPAALSSSSPQMDPALLASSLRRGLPPAPPPPLRPWEPAAPGAEPRRLLPPTPSPDLHGEHKTHRSQREVRLCVCSTAGRAPAQCTQPCCRAAEGRWGGAGQGETGRDRVGQGGAGRRPKCTQRAGGEEREGEQPTDRTCTETPPTAWARTQPPPQMAACPPTAGPMRVRRLWPTQRRRLWLAPQRRLWPMQRGRRGRHLRTRPAAPAAAGALPATPPAHAASLQHSARTHTPRSGAWASRSAWSAPTHDAHTKAH